MCTDSFKFLYSQSSSFSNDQRIKNSLFSSPTLPSHSLMHTIPVLPLLFSSYACHSLVAYTDKRTVDSHLDDSDDYKTLDI